MTRSMTRWTLAGCMALAAMGAAAFLDVGSAVAEAAPGTSRFVGTYEWSYWSAPITISDTGRITSSYTGAGRTKGSISGRVGDDGSYSFTLSQTFGDFPERGKPTYTTSSWKSAGTMEPDTGGNLVVTDTSGPFESFTWFRQ